jgi:antirestriction protein ArdC
MVKHDEKTEAYVTKVAGALAEMIEEGLADPEHWVAPWDHVKASDVMPWNPATAKPYTGGNRWGLFLIGQLTGAPGHWATFKQWQTIGAQVRKGEGSFARALRPLQRSWEDDQTGERHVATIGFGSYAVFHAGQVDGYEMPKASEPREHDDDTAADINAAFTWAATIGVRVHESDTEGAYYSPTLDHVTVPDRGRWHSGDGAWSTIAHECTHWTGHEGRLARTFGKRFGDDAYAVEELCAELGAATVLAMRGRSKEPRLDHAQYLAHWLRVLREKPTALFTAAAAAEKAADYLASRAIDVRQEVAA